MTYDIPQPHDRFLKKMLSQPERAGALLWEHLPTAISRFLSDKPPERVPDSFVEKGFREHFSDRLFQVETIHGKTALLYVLIEHKSAPDNKVGWQLLKYMIEILKDWEKRNPGWDRLPAVVPLVFYHGATEWKIPNEFLHLVDAESGWEEYLLNFRFPVLDLGIIPDAKLSEDKRLRPWLVAMKYATRKDQQQAALEILIPSLQGAPEDLYAIIHYLIRVYRYDEPTIRKIIRDVHPEEEEKMMSQFAEDIRSQFAQEIERKVVSQYTREIERKVISQYTREIEKKVVSQYTQEIERKVRESVLQEGEYKKAAEIARALVNDGMAIHSVSKYSGLSEDEIRKLSVH
uniref:Transposase (putative) YhgA-like domain-containing protein n=1 Tax=Candidatus Kentrum sp. DK TaxID=2126562 RepID=A0A450S4V8_9GAMM|nr:MAG: conserved hypothetical protein (putative transposase or invertase) [Candidatus Kentron sp. DK]